MNGLFDLEEKIMAEQLKNNGFGIVIDDGSIEEKIYNKFGEEIGKFRFRPTDLNMITRFNEVIADFEKITEPLEHLNINSDGSLGEHTDDELKVFNQCTENLFEKLNYIFAADMAKSFFGVVHPFSIINGYFYCENAIEGLGKYISARFDSETKKINRRVNKYTHGYKTGKHKNGGRRKN